MKNHFLGADTDKLNSALSRYQHIEAGLAKVLAQAGEDPLPLEDLDVLEGLEDKISDCRGLIQQIEEALLDSDISAMAYHQSVAHTLRVGA